MTWYQFLAILVILAVIFSFGWWTRGVVERKHEEDHY